MAAGVPCARQRAHIGRARVAIATPEGWARVWLVETIRRTAYAIAATIHRPLRACAVLALNESAKSLLQVCPPLIKRTGSSWVHGLRHRTSSCGPTTPRSTPS